MSLRDEIADCLVLEDLVDEIMNLPAMQSLVKDAERWRKVVKIAKHVNIGKIVP